MPGSGVCGVLKAASVFCLVLSHAEAYVAKRPPARFRQETNNTFAWSDISPSQDLVYHNCYEDFQCACLLLPLDWLNTSRPEQVAIAIIKLPATVPDGHPSHGGTVILHPGGPGGSGTLKVQGAGYLLRDLLDGKRRFEILSFDPRGVARSTPNAYCFEDPLATQLLAQDGSGSGNLDLGPRALGMHWAEEMARGRICAGASERLEILSNGETGEDGTLTEREVGAETVASYDGSRKARAEPKLQYLGFSYGTFLGTTFASLYPNNVRRMVLDGNIDSKDWAGRFVGSSLTDHEATRSYFFERCYNGTTACPLWRAGDSAPSDIQSRVGDLLDRVKQTPVPVVPADDRGAVTVLTYSDLQIGMFLTAYQPLLFFLQMASFLNELLTSNLSLITTSPLWHQPFWRPPCSDTHDQSARAGPNRFDHNRPLDSYEAIRILSADVGNAIHCSDSEDLAHATFADFQAYLSDLVTLSPNGGAITATTKLSCWTWPPELRTKWRFEGPFGSDVPILFTNNRLDPVTPIANARKMAGLHRGSVVLEQDTSGHCALGLPMRCMVGHLRRYLQEGVMPAEGTVCAPDCEAFAECEMDVEDLVDLVELW